MLGAMDTSKMTPGILLGLLFLSISLILPIASLISEIDGILNVFTRLIGESWVISAMQFSIIQAGLSALFSIALALPLAFILANRSGWQKKLAYHTSMIFFSTPSIVIGFGFVLSYGLSGYLNQFIKSEETFLYTKTAVVAAHILVNLPFAVRFLIDSIESIPGEQFKAMEMLPQSKLKKLWLLVIPEIKKPMFTLFMMIFIFCLTSFGIVMTLGGGPHNSTLEVLIYQKLRYDGELAEAAALGVLQMLILFPLITFSFFQFKTTIPHFSTRVSTGKFNQSKPSSIFENLYFSLYLSFLTLPFIAILLDAALNFKSGIQDLMSWATFEAILNSCMIGLISSLLATILAWLFVRDISKGFTKSISLPAFSGLIWFMQCFSPALIALAWFSLVAHLPFDLKGYNFIALIFIHSLLSFPIIARLLLPVSLEFEHKFGHLIESLQISKVDSFFKIEVKENRAHLLSAFLVGFGLSAAEFTAVLMLSGGDFNTITTFLFQLMGAYKYGAAALITVLLLFLLVGVNHLVGIPTAYSVSKIRSKP
jgi:thiamine transport system permease protein